MMDLSPPDIDWDPMTTDWSPMITDWSPMMPTDDLHEKKLTPTQIQEGNSLQSTSDPDNQSNSDIA